MLAWAAIVLALLAAACARPDGQLQPLFEQGQEAMRHGDFAEALKLADTGAARAAGGAGSLWSWRFRLLAAETQILNRDFAAAESAITAAVSPDHLFDPIRARQKFLRAKMSVPKGELQKALQTLTEARRLASGDREIALDIDHLEGQVLLRRSQWGEGEELLTRVVEAAGPSDPFHQAMALNDLGMGRLLRFQYDSALAYFERVVAFDRLRGYTVWASALSNVGSCYQRLGQFDRALAVQRRALEEHERRGKRENLVQALGEMGNVYLIQGQGRPAQPYLKRAFDQAIAANLPREAALWAGNLAEAYELQGEWDEAQKYNDESIRLKDKVGNRRVVFNVTVSAGIAEGRGQLAEARSLYEQALNDPNANANERWGAHAGLAKVAIKGGRTGDAARHFEAALDVIEKSRSDLSKTDYKLSYLTALIAFYRDYVDALMTQGQVERALVVADSSRGQVLAERQHVTAPPRAAPAQLRRLAAETRAVFLSYWLAPSHSYVWVVGPDGTRVTPLAPSGSIEPLVRAYRQTIDNALADPLAADGAGDRLYQSLIAPVAASMPRGSRVVIVPDGPLHGINFETLPVPGPRRHYWIEDVEVQVAPSLASLLGGAAQIEDGHSANDRATALVVGDPLPRPPDFPTLKFASAEMASIARSFADKTTVISRDRATPAAYRDARPERFAFVHFAAHATANVDSPLDSAVILSGPDAAYKLYARDVAAQTLSADLVTVSACRSAGERTYSGEGLIGFAWAFLRAGARRVVAGLWDVDDRSTAELMERMYAALASGTRASHALREAKLALIQRGTRPYAWGAFELFTVVP